MKHLSVFKKKLGVELRVAKRNYEMLCVCVCVCVLNKAMNEFYAHRTTYT